MVISEQKCRLQNFWKCCVLARHRQLQFDFIAVLVLAILREVLSSVLFLSLTEHSARHIAVVVLTGNGALQNLFSHFKAMDLVGFVQEF